MKNSSKHFKRIITELIPFVVILIFAVFMYNNALFMPVKLNGDDYFHLSRIYNLYQNDFQFLYPQNFVSSGRIGVATSIFYPSIIVQLIVDLIPTGLGIITMFRFFLVLNLFVICSSFYLLLRFKLRSKIVTAISISIIWSSFIVVHPYVDNVSGDGLAKVALPFVAFGLMYLHKKNSYRYLYFGVLFSLCCHVLTTVFVVTFIGIYYLVNLFVTKKRFTQTLNVIKAGLFTLLSGLLVIFPLLKLTTENNISAPAQPADRFIAWSYDVGKILLTPTYFLLVAVIIICFILTKVVNRGQVIALIVAVLGTSSVCWPFYLRNSAFTVIQFSWRLLDFGLFMCLAFSLIALSQMELSKKAVKFLSLGAFMLASLLSTQVHDYMFPNIKQDGSIQLASVKSINTSYSKNEDGYHIGQFGAFNDQNTKTGDFWNLINYADYVPEEVKSDSKSQFLMYDKHGSIVASHKIVDENGTVATKNFNSTRNSISFQPVRNISGEKIQLPVLGYNGTKVKVFVNDRQVPYSIEDGQITIQGSFSSNDVIQVKQYIPSANLNAFYVSLLSVLSVLFFFIIKRKNNNKHKH